MWFPKGKVVAGAGWMRECSALVISHILASMGRGTVGAGGAEKLGKHPTNPSISPQP